VRTRSVTCAERERLAVGQRQLLLHPQPERHVRAEPVAPEDRAGLGRKRCRRAPGPEVRFDGDQTDRVAVGEPNCVA
jgi:hypothetical protein